MGISNKKYVFAAITFYLFMVTATVEAKVYIWTDENKQTHYCNDLDDVPKEYREKCRTIESKASSARVPKSNTGHINTAIKDLRIRSRTLNKEMLNLRRQGVKPSSVEYIELKKEYLAVQKQIRQLYNQRSKNQKTKKR